MSDFGATLEAIFRDVVPILGHMGIDVMEAEPGRARVRLPYQEHNGNHIGTIYAGVLFSFLEAAGGALVLTSVDVSRWVPVIVDARIRYRRPVTGPVEATLELDEAQRAELNAALEANPKHSWTITVAATDDLGNVACEADLTYRFRDAGR